MAIASDMYRDGSLVDVMLYPDERRMRIADDSDVPGFSPNTWVWWYLDEDKLLRGEREFLGVEIADITALTESDFAALDAADLPRIDSPEAGLKNAALADVLRWAQQQYLAAQQPPQPAKVS